MDALLQKIKKTLPKSLLGRSLLIMILPILLAQMFAVYMFYERHWSTVSKHMANALSGEIAYITSQVRKNENVDLLDFQQNMGIRSIAVGNFPQTRGKGWKKFNNEDFSSALRPKIRENFDTYRSYNENLWLTRIKISDEKWLEITTSSKRLFNPSTRVFIMWMLASTTLFTGIAVVFLKNQIRPIIKLARLADNFGRGSYGDFRQKAEGAHEVQMAYNAFFKMRDRLARFIRQRTEMLAGISHDLRTPLTRLRLELELIKTKENANNITEMNQDILEMQHMIDGYIDFVRGNETEELSHTNLPELLRNIAKKFTGAEIIWGEVQEISLLAKETSLSRALSNVIENSIKYAGMAKISLHSQGKLAELMVEDNGTGIPENMREDAFRPFFRVDNSRNSKTGGSGLGLAIVKDIVNGHGGEVELGVSELGGLLVRITMPI